MLYLDVGRRLRLCCTVNANGEYFVVVVDAGVEFDDGNVVALLRGGSLVVRMFVHCFCLRTEMNKNTAQALGTRRSVMKILMYGDDHLPPF